MKKLISLLSLIASFYCAKAQQDLRLDVISSVCGNVAVTFYAYDFYTGLQVGVSNQQLYSPGTSLMFTASPNTYPAGFWSTTPSGSWYIGKVDISSDPSCTSASYSPVMCPYIDKLTANAGVGINFNDCFEYSNACGSCSTGDHVHVDYTDGYPGIATLSIDL